MPTSTLVRENDAGFSLYVELGRLDLRDGAPISDVVMGLRLAYERRCMGEEDVPYRLPWPADTEVA